MSKQELLKSQTCVLRVNIHCEGCKRKVKKLLQRTNGVYSTSIDAEQGKVTVTGNVDPATLIKKLEKSGKHAELWGGQQQKVQNNLEINQLKNMQIDSSKVDKDNKAQKGVQKLPQQVMKGPNEKLVVASKDQKAVKLNMPDEDDHGDELYEGGFEVEEHHPSPFSKTVVVKGGGHHVHAPEKSITKNGHDKAAVNIPAVLKDVKGEDDKKGYHKSHGGGFLGCGGLFRGSSKRRNKSMIISKKEIKSVKESGGDVGSKVSGEKEIDKSRNDGALDVNGVKEVIQEVEVGHGKDKGGDHDGGEKKGQNDQMMGKMDQMVGNYPMGQLGQVGAVPMPIQGMHASGYYQGSGRGMAQGNPYEQLHYMGPSPNPMMTHQRPTYGQDMQHQHMMHGRPHPQEVNYVPPMPPPGSEPYSLYFSDENPNGCSIM